MTSDDGWVRFPVAFANAATRSGDINITGYAAGNVVVPAGVRGVFRWRSRNADTGASGRIYDETNTAVVQSMLGYTRPLTMAIHPRVMSSARIVKLCTTTALTAAKTLDVFLKF